MATTTSSFNLTINGVTTAITNVQSLDSAIQTLEAQLNTAQFGTQQFQDLQQQLQRARAAMAQIQAQTQATSQAANNAGQNASQMGSQFQDAFGIANLAGGQTAQVIGQVQGSFQSLQGGIGTVTKAFGTLRGAIAATGIGLLVIGLTALVTAFSNSEKASNLLDRKLKALQAVFQLIINVVTKVGESLIAALQNPKKALTDLVDVIQNNLMNRLKSFAVVLDGIRNADFEKVTNGVLQFGTGIENVTGKAREAIEGLKQFGKEAAAAAAEAEKIAASNQKIAVEERALNVARAESRAQIEALKKASEDVTKSTVARIEASRQAASIENGLIKEQLALTDRKIKNLVAELRLKKNITKDDKDALSELRIQRAEILQESLGLQTELQNTLNGLRQEQKDKDKQAADERKAANQKEAEEAKKLAEARLADDQAATDIQFDITKKSLERRLALEKAGTPEFLAIQKELRTLEESVTLEAIDRKYLKAGEKEKAALLKQKADIVATGIEADKKLEKDNQKAADELSKARLVAAATTEKELADIKLIGLREGSKEYYSALIAQIDAEEKLALAGLDNTKENENKRTAIIKQAAQDRKAVLEAEANQPFNIGTSILTKIFGVKDGEVDDIKAAIDSMMAYSTQATMTILATMSEARVAALEAQTRETQVIIDAAKQASDSLKSELDESQSRIDGLESKLVNTKGLERQKLLDQLTEERRRNAQIAADKRKEDDRIKTAEAEKLALEQKRTKEQEKQQKIQGVINALSAIGAATKAVEAVASAGAGGKFGFDNIAYIIGATAAIAAAVVAVKSALSGFAEGGFTGSGFGTPDNTGYKVAGVVHENEWVAPKWMVESPKFGGTIAQLESARNKGGYAQGGYTSVSVPAPQQGIDLSILMDMQGSILATNEAVRDLAQRPIYTSVTQYEQYVADNAALRAEYVR